MCTRFSLRLGGRYQSIFFLRVSNLFLTLKTFLLLSINKMTWFFWAGYPISHLLYFLIVLFSGRVSWITEPVMRWHFSFRQGLMAPLRCSWLAGTATWMSSSTWSNVVALTLNKPDRVWKHDGNLISSIYLFVQFSSLVSSDFWWGNDRRSSAFMGGCGCRPCPHCPLPGPRRSVSELHHQDQLDAVTRSLFRRPLWDREISGWSRSR